MNFHRIYRNKHHWIKTTQNLPDTFLQKALFRSSSKEGKMPHRVYAYMAFEVMWFAWGISHFLDIRLGFSSIWTIVYFPNGDSSWCKLGSSLLKTWCILHPKETSRQMIRQSLPLTQLLTDCSPYALFDESAHILEEFTALANVGFFFSGLIVYDICTYSCRFHFRIISKSLFRSISKLPYAHDLQWHACYNL